MQSWMGNVIGAAIGLVAILIGALWNAYLMRKRDAHLREQETRSISSALASELRTTLDMTAARFMQAALDRGGMSKEVLLALKPSALVVWPKLADKLGLLEPRAAVAAIQAFSLLDWHMAMTGVTIDEAINGSLKKEAAKLRAQAFANDWHRLNAAIEMLGGEPVKGLPFVEFGIGL